MEISIFLSFILELLFFFFFNVYEYTVSVFRHRIFSQLLLIGDTQISKCSKHQDQQKGLLYPSNFIESF